MKLLQINSVANLGSTGRITEGVGNVALSNGWLSYIAYGRNANKSQSQLIKIGNQFDIKLHGFLTRIFDNHSLGVSSKKATQKLIEEIEEIDPNIIVLHNLHGYYINVEVLFSFLKRYKKPVYWILYDCWAFTGHCAYFDLVNCEKWKEQCQDCPAKYSYPTSLLFDNSKNNYKIKRNIFTDIENLQLIANSNWLREKIKQSYLKNYPVHLINNGIDLSVFKTREYSKLPEKYNLTNKFVILGIAATWTERKGLQDFFELSKHLKNDEIIVLDGLNETQRKNLPTNIVSLDRAENTLELSELYSWANVYFNPTYEDNFPTTNLEALACGTPVITYDTGGSPEAIDQKTGYVVQKGDVEKAYEAILKIKKSSDSSSACRSRAEKYFDYKERFMDFINLFEKQVSI